MRPARLLLSRRVSFKPTFSASAPGFQRSLLKLSHQTRTSKALSYKPNFVVSSRWFSTDNVSTQAAQDAIATNKKRAEDAAKEAEANKIPQITLERVTEDHFPAHINKLADDIASLNVVEITILMKALSGKFGVSFEQMMSMSAPSAPAAAAPAAEAPKEEPKEEVKVKQLKLVKIDEGAKYKVLKEIRALIPGMKMDESKKYVENLPAVLVEAATEEDLNKWKEKMGPAGAHVELA